MSRACRSLLLAGLLAGCGLQPGDDLRAWIADAREAQQSLPAPVVPQLTVESFRYEPGSRGDPFDPVRLNQSGGSRSAELEPDMQRSREALESFALDHLRLVGSLRRGREVVALVQADRLIYQVRLGNYLGQDFGRVIAISETGIDIEERIRDSGGAWTRRRARLPLQER